MYEPWFGFTGGVALRYPRAAVTMAEPPADDRPISRLTPLEDTALLLVEGVDAVPFLQGQVTCDVKALAEGQVTLGALCNPKGRVIATFRLFRWNEHCCLILRCDMIDAVRNVLQRYVLRARVTLRDGRSAWSVLGLLGKIDDRSAAALGLSACPLVGHGASAARGAWVLAVDRAQKYLILAPTGVGAEIEAALGNQELAVRDSPSEWQRADIRDGVPNVPPATTEQFVPQMLNLDLLGGIGFEKGCYTGQEVVARSHYLGTVKRRMHRFRVHSDRVPQSGARLTGEGDEPPIGHVLTAAELADSSYELLAVVANDRVRDGSVRLWLSSGPKLERIALPYLDAALAREDSSP